MSVRKGGKWRERMFKSVWLTQMGKCEHCGAAEHFIWRKGGISGSFADGDLHQIVWRTSNLELDHITPLYRGGSNEYDNLQLLCCACHRVKTTAEHPRCCAEAFT
jgi:hypothetical protein